MKVITHNQVYMQRTTQNCLNQNFIKFMHKPRCTHCSQLWNI